MQGEIMELRRLRADDAIMPLICPTCQVNFVKSVVRQGPAHFYFAWGCFLGLETTAVSCASLTTHVVSSPAQRAIQYSRDSSD